MYAQGWNIVPLDKLFKILHTIPPGSWVGVSISGALSVLDPKGEYLGYIDLAYEERFFPKEEVETNAAKQLEKVGEGKGPGAADS